MCTVVPFGHIRREKDRVALRGGQNWLGDVICGTRPELDIWHELNIFMFFLPFVDLFLFGFDFGAVKLFSKFFTSARCTH